MHMKNRAASFAWKCASALACFSGLFLYSGLPQGKFRPAMFLFFTIQTNCLCLIWFVCAAVQEARRGGKKIPALIASSQGAVLLAILIVMIVYWTLLHGANARTADFEPLPNALVHLVSALAMLLDWLFFAEKGRMKKTAPLFWLALPLGYYLFAVIAARAGATYYGGASRYAYFFIDSDALGTFRVLINVALMALGFLLLGCGIFGLDRLLAGRPKGQTDPKN